MKYSRRELLAIAGGTVASAALAGHDNAWGDGVDETLIARTIHVSVRGSDSSGDGSDARPYATIRRALSVAGSAKNAGIGVKVLIAAGVYREGSAGENWSLQFTSFTTSAPLVIDRHGGNEAFSLFGFIQQDKNVGQ